MDILLRAGAKISEYDVLVLKEDQIALRDSVNGVAFVNGNSAISVTKCTACVQPTVYVNYPERISAGCASLEPPRATFDGSLTRDYTGRALDCSWSVGVDRNSNHCFRSSESETTRFSCPDLEERVTAETYAIDSSQNSIVSNRMSVLQLAGDGFLPDLCGDAGNELRILHDGTLLHQFLGHVALQRV